MKSHPFFEAIEMASKLEKKIGQWGAGTASQDRRKFFRALPKAHPFVFDRKVTIEKRLAGRTYTDFENLVEEFSMPFSTSLYLMTDAPTIICPVSEDRPNDTMMVTLLGYLIDEIDPETFKVFEVSWGEVDGRKLPVINTYELQLKTLDMAFRMANALDMTLFDKTTEAYFLKESSSIMQFTNSISVKRLGIEKPRPFVIRTRDMGAGYTTIKYDNLIHIADKVEYEYVTPLADNNINWDYRGFWRGHWRALYFSNSITDSYGRRVVDYSRNGKNRQGEYVVPGYTWVIEHTKGDPAFHEIKTHTVKASL